MSTLAITYRFVAPNTMLDAVAGAIARSLFKTKALLVAKTPLASQIEAPDPDDKNPVLPVHPGVASYLNSGEQSFFDEFQQYFYLGGMVLSMAGSGVALLIGLSLIHIFHPVKHMISPIAGRSRFAAASGAGPIEAPADR